MGKIPGKVLVIEKKKSYLMPLLTHPVGGMS